MKKYFLFLALLIVVQIKIKAQQTQFNAADHYTVLKPTALTEADIFSKKIYASEKYGPDRDADFYLHRSKSQRTVGWITLGGGIILSGVGLLIASNNEGSYVDTYGNTIGNDNTALAATLTIAGGLSGIVSIPFMIMASGNKHKGRLMLKNQSTGLGVPPNAGKYITGITMTIPIGK